MNQIRIKGLIDEAIQKHKLNLDGFVILTEAATGYFFVTPIIAAKAGARKVFALAKNSSYATAEKAAKFVLEKAKKFGVEKKIEIITELSKAIDLADIITNLGSIRPIDKKKIELINPTAAITLMYEPWELRKTDVDIEACRKKRIMVLGTNEDAPTLRIFECTKSLILKMLFEHGLEIYQNNFLVISSDKFGKLINETLIKNQAKSKLMPSSRKIDLKKIGFNRLDAIIIADYLNQKTILGREGIVDFSSLEKVFPEVKIIQFAGKVDGSNLPAQKMARTFNELGPKPVIDLIAAGLKVGEEMARARRKFSDINKAKKEALKNPLCQDLKG